MCSFVYSLREVINYGLLNNSIVTVIFRWSDALHMMQESNFYAPALRMVPWCVLRIWAWV